MNKLTQKTKSKSSKKIKLPLFTYFCLLLVVAMLCTSATYARYISQSQDTALTGVVPLACSFSIDEMSSLTFANSDYRLNIEGVDTEMNLPRTIAFSVRNYDVDENGNNMGVCDVALQCTFRLYATKEFLDNVAFQMAEKVTVDKTTAPLTQQYILKDLIDAATSGQTTFSTTNWNSADKSKDFGELPGRAEEIISLTNHEFNADAGSGKIVAIAQADNETKESVATISISAENRANVPYSVNFMRGIAVTVGNDMTAPAYYADCMAHNEVYYCLDITLPSMTLPAGGTAQTDQYLFNFTLTDKQNAGELANSDLSYDAFMATVGASGNKSLTGEHFNVIIPSYTDSACTTLYDDSTTVRVENEFTNGDATSISSTKYYLIQGASQTLMTVDETSHVASCTVGGQSYYVPTQYTHNGTIYNLNDYTYNHETVNKPFEIYQLVGKTYPVEVRVLFTQASNSVTR